MFFCPGNDVGIYVFYWAKNHSLFRGGNVKRWIKKDRGICDGIFLVSI
jgi:hypothetical protein